ncbi:hypothetical protein PVAND_005429 [Polypedilum vanderplanki]|uniref:Neural proliferation differentiation and control protein n=1 Tax=Polypedilum vanderplanki TaxID=319348 RepID=A0A9J6C108_POLVA|nr:hypothetical protein PVAND_005429 [Polypedilum vanderplanki]
MNQIILILAFLALFSEFVASEYPGRRRHQYNQQNVNEKEFLIEQLSNFIDQQARRKFQQQFHMHHQKQYAPISNQEIPGHDFTFQIPPIVNTDFNTVNNEPIDFAVHPFDSRYYESSPQQTYDEGEVIDEENEKIETSENEDDNDEEIESIKSLDPNPELTREILTEHKGNKILIPSPMHVHDTPASALSFSSSTTGDSQPQRILHRPQKQQLQQQLLNKQTASDVLQKPLQVEFDNTTSLYIVALIAGLSCAFSTGLIALGLMYWTLKKKVKSADACDYTSCDYGVVGPRSVKSNIDTQVALGDKKLAHSAQMFHYQHQKNQIIAMENRNGTELSHNDDENDSDENENDFTVYECPGLAEWSDSGIEVKNPLFSEETPATKTEKAQPANKTASKK